MRRIRHFFHHRPHLIGAIVLGIIAGAFTPLEWHPVTRALAGWNVTVWSYLMLMAWLMTRSSHAQIDQSARQEDESAIAVLVIMSVAAVASMAAIIVELSTITGLPSQLRLLRYLFTAATVFGSWCLVATLFTFHYTHAFFRSPVEQRALGFSGPEKEHNYWDFLYLSFTIAVAAQTADVTLNTRAMRKAVLAQSILSFWFNVAIVGLSINIAASLVGG